MKILYITTTPTPYKVEFFEELGKECELTVLFENKTVSYRNDNWMIKRFENFKGIFLGGIHIKDKLISLQFIKYINGEYDFIIIGVYSTITEILAQLYMRKKGIPYILSSDGGIIKKDKLLQKKMKNMLIGKATYYLSTGAITSEYLEYYGANKDNIYIYPFSSIHDYDILKKADSNKKKEELRTELNIKESKIIISVGQYIYRKGYDLLIKNASKWNDVGIYIVGGTPSKEYLKLTEIYKAENIHFVDFLTKEKLKKYYRAADIFVLPTREDIWGLVINEAMSNGLPIITTNKCVAGMEMIKSDKIGCIIEVDNEEQLVNTVSNFLENIEIKTHAEIILDTAKKYTIEKMASAHIEIFKKLRKKARKYE